MKTIISLWLSVALPVAGAFGETAAVDSLYEDDLSRLSFEELMDIPLTSTAKKSVKLSDSLAAVYVITAEDIHEYGLASIPEALRLVPGVEVGRLDANKYAIGVRGASSRFSDMLLVLVDGRSVYNPLFSGVLWESLDVVMEDIDRIEVIRGPGATLWGANAVNGVINIITKNTAATQGRMITNRAGTAETYTGVVRTGGRLGESGTYRLTGKYRRHDNFETPTGERVNDDYETGMGSLRADWRLDERNRLTTLAQFGKGTVAENDYALTSFDPPYGSYLLEDARFVTAHALVRWEHDDASGGQTAIQTYVDHTDYDYPTFAARHNTTDLEVQHRWRPAGRHEIIWGLGARVVDTETNGSYALDFVPGRRQDLLAQTFVQDEIALKADALAAVVGVKVERNEFTGIEVQPNLRLRWQPDPRYTVWGAWSRAVRTPAMGPATIDLLLDILPVGDPANPGPVPVQVRFQGNRDLESVNMIAKELGFRAQLASGFGADLALFHNAYDKTETPGLGEPYLGGLTPEPYYVQPVRQENGSTRTTYGGELSLEYTVSDFWQLRGWASFLHQDDGERSDDLGTNLDLTSDPDQQFGLRSAVDLPEGLHASVFLRYVDELESVNIDAYTELDVWLAWHPSPKLRLAVGGRNLLHENHREYLQDSVIISREADIPRAFSGLVKLEF